ncbi:hypothetical protein Hanom_Chr11g01029631 [Helianthus anomalus]
MQNHNLTNQNTYIIGFRDGFEFGFCIFLVVRVFIRVPFHGEFSVGFLQVIVFSTAIDLKNLVVVHTHGYDG